MSTPTENLDSTTLPQPALPVLRRRLAFGIVLAVIASALAALSGFLVIQQFVFAGVSDVFGINAYIKYELPFYPFVAGPLIWLLWRFDFVKLSAYAWPASVMGVGGAVVSLYIRYAMGDPGIVNLVAVSSDETAANLFTLLVFSICALPISLAAACAGWLMMHGVYRVPRRAAFLSHKAA